MVSPQGPSSFIPKVSANRNAPRPRGIKKIYIFTYISLVLFFGTLIASAGTFFFDISVQGQLAQQKEQLANERNAFNASDLARLRDLEQRIESAKRILNSHVSVSTLFTALEESTIAGVQLTGVEYERTSAGGINFAVGARTESLNTARFQRDTFAANEVLRSAGVIEPEFRNLQNQSGTQSTDEAETVLFALAGTFSVADVQYTPENITLPSTASLEDDELIEIDATGDSFQADPATPEPGVSVDEVIQ